MDRDRGRDRGVGWDERLVVGVDWLRTRLGDAGVRVVDARAPERFNQGHIPGAVNSDVYALKLRDSSPAAIAAYDVALGDELRRIGVQPGDAVVFYEEISGTSAARGVWMLDYAGLGGGRLLDGGLAAWVGAGLPLEQASIEPAPSDVTIQPQPELLATADGLLEGIAGPATARPIVLDTRNPIEYRSGTIPGAVHLEWADHLRPDGSLRPPAEVRYRYAQAGIVPEEGRAVVAFCASGYRAAHSYVLLRALGFGDVRNYAASWGEWGARPDLPIERPGR